MRYIRYIFLGLTVLASFVYPMAGYIFLGCYVAAALESVRTGDF